MSLHDDLVAAKALIPSPRLWRQGDRHPDSLCAMMAVGRVTQPGGQSNPRFDAARSAMMDALPADSQSRFSSAPVVTFNDDPATTHADIMALFDRAIAGSVQS